MSNLNERKANVLKIAAENFHMVKRLERVRSAVGPGGCQKHTGISPERARRISVAYPNVLDVSNLLTFGKL